MKIGSLYIIRSGTAIGRCVGSKSFQRLSIGGESECEITDHSCKTLITADNVVLWSTIPTKRRHYMHNDTIYILSNGIYTMYPMKGSFLGYNDNGSVNVYNHFTVTNYNVPIQTIRPWKYGKCEKKCKNAVICWLLLSRFLIKDIRTLIGKTIWETREYREWETSEKP